MSILNPLFYAVAWVIMRIHAVLAVPFGPSSGWAWGLSIVVLVMLLRLIMVPLFVKQVRSQRKMQGHMPQLQEIRKRYKNDKQRLNEETMKFYKENGINPLGGCLPLVAQFPVFWALFDVLRAISTWKPGTTPSYGLTVPVVQSAQHAHIFGALLSDRFLYPVPGETLSSRIVILIAVIISASTTFLTMRQSAKRGMLNQGAPADPDQPGAAFASSMSKNMQYIAPFFALTGLYWQFGLVIYWVTTNVWTLGQQHFLFRNLPVVGSTEVGASTAPAVTGSGGASAKSASAKSVLARNASAKAKAPSVKAPSVKAPSAKAADSGKGASATSAAAAKGKATTPSPSPSKTSAAKTSAAKTSAPKTSPAKPKTSPAKGSGSTAGANGSGGTGRGLLRLGKAKQEPAEATPAAPPTRVVRQQPVRQSRSKRSGSSGKR